MTGWVTDATFTGDGRLVIGTVDGRVQIWENYPEALVRLAGRVAGRNLTLAGCQQFFPGRTYRPTFLDRPFPEDDPKFGAIARNLTRQE